MYIFLAVQALFTLGYAGPSSPITAQSVCASVRSSNYEAQCESAIHNGYFESAALRICLMEIGDYEKKSCMEVIANRTYTPQDLSACLTGEKARLFKCLSRSGSTYVAPVGELERPVPTGN